VQAGAEVQGAGAEVKMCRGEEVKRCEVKR